MLFSNENDVSGREKLNKLTNDLLKIEEILTNQSKGFLHSELFDSHEDSWVDKLTQLFDKICIDIRPDSTLINKTVEFRKGALHLAQELNQEITAIWNLRFQVRYV